MVASGADIIDLDWMVDWRTACDRFGSRVALCGNVDPVSVMLRAAPETVYKRVGDCLRAGGQRCFSAAGCEIPDGTPPENLRAQARALYEY
jgi:uroporphyrinogen decarboxylase